MRKFVRISVLAHALFACGCASYATLTVRSQPTGAYITGRGSYQPNLAPVSYYFDAAQLAPFKDSKGCYRVAGLSARWVSGATAKSADPIRLCGGVTGTYEVVLKRPDTVSGLEKDLEFALKVESLQAQQRAATAAEWAATAAILAPATAPTTPPICTSYRGIDGSVNTNCF